MKKVLTLFRSHRYQESKILRRLGTQIAEYKMRYAGTMSVRRFFVMLSDGANSFMFDHRNMRQDTDIGSWVWQWTLL